MKILVVRLGALGDIVHTLPAVAALRSAYPAAQIDWVVDRRYQEVLSLVDAIDECITIEPSRRWRELTTVLRRLRGREYDVALDFQGLIKSAVLARLCGAERVIGFERHAVREPAAALFYGEHRGIPRGQHVIHKNLRLAGVLGIDVSRVEFPLDIPPPPGADRPYVLLNPGAAWPNKRWPPARFGELAAWLHRRYGLGSMVLWGPDEQDLAREVVDASDGAAGLAPRTGIADLLALARGARLVVAGDTGPLHLAAAAGARVLGLYGPTNPARNGPWREEDVAISHYGQCVCHYQRRCRRRRSRPCIEHITLAAVRSAIERLLG